MSAICHIATSKSHATIISFEATALAKSEV